MGTGFRFTRRTAGVGPGPGRPGVFLAPVSGPLELDGHTGSFALETSCCTVLAPCTSRVTRDSGTFLGEEKCGSLTSGAQGRWAVLHLSCREARQLWLCSLSTLHTECGPTGHFDAQPCSPCNCSAIHVAGQRSLRSILPLAHPPLTFKSSCRLACQGVWRWCEEDTRWLACCMWRAQSFSLPLLCAQEPPVPGGAGGRGLAPWLLLLPC